MQPQLLTELELGEELSSYSFCSLWLCLILFLSQRNRRTLTKSGFIFNVCMTLCRYLASPFIQHQTLFLVRGPAVRHNTSCHEFRWHGLRRRSIGLLLFPLLSVSHTQ